MSLEEILSTVREWPEWVTFGVLFFGALIEYVFPPIPGDTIVVAGAVLVGAFGWSLVPVYLVVTAGAIIGSAADFGIGRWLIRSGRLERMGPKKRAAIDVLVRRFERHGAWYLAVNRFLPGIRAFFFVAAGIAGLRMRVVILWSTVSAMLWNALLVLAGYFLGDNLVELEAWLGRYNAVVWALVSLILAVVAWKVYRVVKARGSTDASVVELGESPEGDRTEEIDGDRPHDEPLEQAVDGTPPNSE